MPGTDEPLDPSAEQQQEREAERRPDDEVPSDEQTDGPGLDEFRPGLDEFREQEQAGRRAVAGRGEPRASDP
jgi:hypothetical protein